MAILLHFLWLYTAVLFLENGGEEREAKGTRFTRLSRRGDYTGLHTGLHEERTHGARELSRAQKQPKLSFRWWRVCSPCPIPCAPASLEGTEEGASAFQIQGFPSFWF